MIPVDGGVSVQVDTAAAALLEPWDVAILRGAGGRLQKAGPPDEEARPAVFLATLQLMRGQ